MEFIRGLEQYVSPSQSWEDVCCVYLLLTQDQQALWFDGMIWSQILSTPPLDTILESFPNAIASGPGHADVMPLSIVDEERQLCHLEEDGRM